MDRFEAIKLAFTEAKKTGTSLKTKHIEWLILEVESLIAEWIKMGKQVADFNAIGGSNQKRYERAESKILQLQAHLNASAEVIKEYEVDVAGYIDDAHECSSLIGNLRRMIKFALREAHFTHCQFLRVKVENCENKECLMYKKTLEESE